MSAITVLSLSLVVALALALTGCPSPPSNTNTTPTPTATSSPTPEPPTQVCVDFEPPLVAGTQYGTPAGQAPGAVVFTTNGIPVSIQNFNFVGGGGGFNSAEIEAATASFGSGQIIRTNNLNLEFDFTAVGFPVSQVQFEFLDLGGSENVSVNGSPIFAGDIASTPGTLGGVNVTVTSAPVPSGKKGTVTFTGAVSRLRIGGQEFWIDQVCMKVGCLAGQRLCSGQCVNACPTPQYGYACGVCTSCNGTPFGSNSTDDCRIQTGGVCPAGYSNVSGVCVRCGPNGGGSSRPLPTPTPC
jgi:hypothetical protein